MFDTALKIQSLMRDFKSNWSIAGGWAIDLYLGKQTRSHEDIEIAVFRQDQVALQEYLDKNWILKKAVDGELSEWEKGEFLELPVHGIHCFNRKFEVSFLEVLLNERNENNWIYRRNSKIKRSISEVFNTSSRGIKILSPEVVLLYKSKTPRLKDKQDFETVVQELSADSRKWLKNALKVCYAEHFWLQKL